MNYNLFLMQVTLKKDSTPRKMKRNIQYCIIDLFCFSIFLKYLKTLEEAV